MGASALTSNLRDFIFGDEADPDRIEFERKAAAGMRRNFLRWHTVELSRRGAHPVVDAVCGASVGPGERRTACVLCMGEHGGATASTWGG